MKYKLVEDYIDEPFEKGQVVRFDGLEDKYRLVDKVYESNGKTIWAGKLSVDNYRPRSEGGRHLTTTGDTKYFVVDDTGDFLGGPFDTVEEAKALGSDKLSEGLYSEHFNDAYAKFESDVYNALGEIVGNYVVFKHYDVDQEDVEHAVNNFIVRFFDDYYGEDEDWDDEDDDEVYEESYRKLEEQTEDQNIKSIDAESNTVELKRSFIQKLNKLANKYNGYMYPKEIPALWEELSDLGIDVGMFTGSGKEAEDGGKSWTKTFEYKGMTVSNSMIVYSFYEPSNSDRNEYLIYFS